MEIDFFILFLSCSTNTERIFSLHNLKMLKCFRAGKLIKMKYLSEKETYLIPSKYLQESRFFFFKKGLVISRLEILKY